jgi:hypothetical protein
MMLTPVHDHPTPAPPTSGPVRSTERAALIPERAALIAFASDDALHKLMRADSARRFADFRATLRDASQAHRSAPRPPADPGSLSHAAARLEDATTHYEQHVLAWYALGRVTQARAAHDAITRCREALAAEESVRNASRRHRQGSQRRRELQHA